MTTTTKTKPPTIHAKLTLIFSLYVDSFVKVINTDKLKGDPELLRKHYKINISWLN